MDDLSDKLLSAIDEIARLRSENKSLRTALSTASADGMEAAARIADEHATFLEETAKKHPENSQSRDRCFARAKAVLVVSAAIRAAMEKEE